MFLLNIKHLQEYQKKKKMLEITILHLDHKNLKLMQVT